MKRLSIITTLALFLLTNLALGQDTAFVVQPLSETKKCPVTFNLWGYGMGARTKHANLWTANNPSYVSNKLYCTYWDAGLSFDIARRPRNLSSASKNKFTNNELMNIVYTLHTSLGLGYRYEAYAFQSSGQEKLLTGIVQHRLTCEANVKYYLFTLGLTTDFLLKSVRKDQGDFSHIGLYDDCFNRTTFRWYLGIYFPVSFIELEGRVGWYIVPQLDVNKFAYHNMNTGHWDGFYWELRLAFRLFTTGHNLL